VRCDSGGAGVSPASRARRNSIPGRAASAGSGWPPRTGARQGARSSWPRRGVATGSGSCIGLNLPSSWGVGAGRFAAELLGQALNFPRMRPSAGARARQLARVLARSPSGQPRLARPPAGTPAWPTTASRAISSTRDAGGRRALRRVAACCALPWEGTGQVTSGEQGRQPLRDGGLHGGKV